MRKYRFLSVILFIFAAILLVGCQDKKFNVSFDLDGGNVAGNTETIVLEIVDGNTFEESQIPVPVKTGYTLDGWTLDGADFAIAEAVITGDITLKAKWVPISLEVTLQAGGETLEVLTVLYNNNLERPEDPVLDGHQFDHWTLDGEAVTFPLTVTDNITLVAVFSKGDVVVTFDTVGGSSVASQTVKFGDTINEPTIPTKAHHVFEGWFIGLNKVTFPYTVNEDVTLKASWTLNEYTVTFDVAGGSVVEAITSDALTKITEPTAPTKEHHTFDGWYLDDEKIVFPYELVADVTLVAKWELVEYTVTFDVAGGTAVEPVKVAALTKLAAPNAPTKEGHTFVEWQLDGVAYNFDSTVDKDITLKAVWSINTFALTLPTGVSVLTSEIDVTKVAYGTEVEFLIEVEEGKVLKEVKANDTLVVFADNKFFVTVKEDTTITFKTEVSETIQQELEAELAAISDAITVKLPGTEEVTSELVAAAVLFNEDIATLTVTGTFPEYSVTLTSLFVDFSVTKVITVSRIDTYTLEIPESVEVVSPVGLILTEVIDGQEVVLQVTTPDFHIIKSVKFNDEDVLLDELNQFTVIIDSNSVIVTEFELDPEIVDEVQAELDKIDEQIILIGVIEVTIPAIEDYLAVVVDADLVSYYVELTETGATITLISTKTELVFLSVEVLVDVERVNLEIQLNGGTIGEETSITLSVPKGSTLTRSLVEGAVNGDKFIDKFYILDNEEIEVAFGSTIDEDLTIVAVWIEGFTINFDLGEATGEIETQYVPTGETGTMPSFKPQLPGLITTKWLLDGEQFDFNTILTESIVLTPHYENYLKYHEVNGEIVIDGLLSGFNIEVIHLPEEIDGMPVVAVASRAFYHNSVIRTFIGNEGLREIGHLAFDNSSGLVDVVLPSTLQHIGNYAFSRTGIKSIAIPMDVHTIGHRAFYSTQSLQTVVFDNENFININRLQFESSLWLNLTLNGQITNENGGLAIVNGVVIGALNQHSGDIVVPSHVLRIGAHAFNKRNIPSIILNEGLLEIGEHAFDNSSISEIVFPASLEKIGFKAFARTYSLKTASFEDAGANVKVISDYAFESSGLVNFEIPTGLTRISEGLFLNASNLIALNGTQYNVDLVEKSAFSGTAWLANEQAGNPYVLFGDILIDASLATNSSPFPTEATSIAEWAFHDPQGLTSVSIPDSIKVIRSGAFVYNQNILSISLSGYIEVVEDSAIIAHGKNTLTVTVSDIDSKPEAWGTKWLDSRQQWSPTNVAVSQLIWSPVITVRFELNGGELENPLAPVVIDQGELVVDPEVLPVREGFVFLGWHLGEDYFYFKNSILTRSVTLTARWGERVADYDFEIVDGKAKFIEWTNKTSTEAIIPDAIYGFVVDEIYEEAFNGVSGLESVKLPSQLEVLGSAVFKGLSSLATIEIGTEVKSFGHNAFAGTQWLEDKQTANQLVIINDILVSGHVAEGTVIVPGSVKIIESYAFEDATSLQSLVIEEGVILVRENALIGATALETVKLPHSLRSVESNSFVTGTELTIDATDVYHVRPTGYPADWVDELATVNWLDAITYEVVLSNNIEPTDIETVLHAIVEDSEVEFEITIPQYKRIVSLTANELDIMDLIDESGKLFTYQVVADTEIVVEFDFLEELIDQIDGEFGKVGDDLGIESTGEGNFADLSRDLATLLDTDKVEYVVTPIQNTDDLYRVTLYSVYTRELTRTKIVKVLPLLDVNSSLSFVAQSGQANSAEHGRYMFDNDRINTKWCDNGGSSVKYVTMKLAEITKVGKFAINHAGVKEEQTFNTAEFMIEVSLDGTNWTTVVDVDDNSETQTEHAIPLTEALYIRFSSTKGAQDGHVTRVYDFRVYGAAEAVVAEFDFNGGLASGMSSRVVNILKNGVIEPSSIPVPTKQHYRLAGWLLNDEVMITQSQLSSYVFTEDVLLTAVWEVLSSVSSAVNNELNKIKDPTVVVAEIENQPTMDEIISGIEELVDLDVVTVEVVDFVPEEGEDAPIDSTYLVTLTHAVVTDVKASKTVVIYTKLAEETVDVTFNLNGGSIEEVTDNVVVVLDKGSTVSTADIPIVTPPSENYVFAGWMLDGELVTVQSVVLLENYEFVAKWEASPLVMYEVYVEFAKIPEMIAVNSDNVEPSLEEIIATITALINIEKVDLELTKIDEFTYKLELISRVVGRDFVVEKEIQAGKAVTFSSNIGAISVLGTQDSQLAILGIENRFEIILVDGMEIEYVLIDDYFVLPVSKTQFLFTPSNNLVVEVYQTMDVDFEMQALNTMLGQIDKEVSIDNFVEGHTHEDVIQLVHELWVNELYEISLEDISIDNYVLTLTHPLNDLVSGSKEITIIPAGITSTKISGNYIDALYPGYDFSNADAGHALSNLIDETNGEPNLTTSWKDSTGRTGGWSPNPMGSKFVYIYNASIPVVNEIVISLAGAKVGGNPADNNTDFDIHWSPANYHYMLSPTENNKIASIRGNTESVVRVPVSVNSPIGTILIIFRDGNVPAEIADVSTYKIEGPTAIYPELNLEGGSYNGSTEPVLIRGIRGEQIGIIDVIPTLLNHTFSHWVTSNGTVVTEETVFNSNEKLRAVYERTTTPTVIRNITFDLNGGQIGESTENVVLEAYNQETYRFGLIGDLPANPTREGYVFVGWFRGTTEFNLDIRATSDATYTAMWALDQTQINYVLFILETQKVPTQITVEDLEEFNAVQARNAINELVDTSIVRVDVTLVSGQKYRVILTSISNPEFVVMKEVTFRT